MKYEIIDLENWPRGGLFKYYIDELRVVMSLTVDIDVTRLVEFVRQRRLKFYPAMIWLVSKAINSRDEFKYGWDKNGHLIKYDFVSPSYAVFHPEDGAFTKLVTEYSDDLFEFLARFARDQEASRNLRAVTGNQPENHFDVSCLPWVRYRHADLHVFDEGKFLAPVVTWGKYTEEAGRLTMPLSMNIHHAVADGFHLSRFFADIQNLLDSIY